VVGTRRICIKISQLNCSEDTPYTRDIRGAELVSIGPGECYGRRPVGMG
jgi:hypothetical protein